MKVNNAKPESPLELNITGMSCASCVGRVEKALLAVPGVSSANVNLARARATLEFGSNPPDAQALVKAVKDAGYSAAVARDRRADARDRAAQQHEEMAALKQAFLIAAVLTLPVFALEMGSRSE